MMKEETRRKISMARKGKGGLRGSLNPFFGKKYTEEEKELRRQASKRAWADPDFRKNQIEKRTGKFHSDETKKKMSLSMRGIKRSDAARANISMAAKKRNAVSENNAMYGKKHSEHAKNKIGLNSKKALARLWADPSYRMKMSQVHKELWADEKYKEVAIQRMARASHRKPNKPETKIMNLLNEIWPGEWRYVGDGQLIISGLNPDFVNCNGQKKIIEMFGDYWHRGENPEYRASVFKPFGYETLVIWERELKNIKAVENKIRLFARKAG